MKGFAWSFIALSLCHSIVETRGEGIYRKGASARSMALGGTDVASPEGPLDAIFSNPAGLSLIASPTLQLGVSGAFAQGEFSNSVNNGRGIDEQFQLVPQAAFGMNFGKASLTLGVVPETALEADWVYNDAPGVAGATYGEQRHRSSFLGLKASVAGSVEFCEAFSVGASFGALYNRNELEVPYVFQSHPALAGLKTLLDLETEGWGYGGSLGMLIRPLEAVQIGFSYQLRTSVRSEGDANGNIGAQLQALGGAAAGFRPDFHYDAEVDTAFPQIVKGGIAWTIHPQLRSQFQVEWVNWSDSFDDLPVHLTGGNNTDINGFLGRDGIEDNVPLNWKDRMVYRAGLEYSVCEGFDLRAGYAYGKSPVPDETLTPLTAVITEHTISGGFGVKWSRYAVDFAYQYELPEERTVGNSGLRSGEYSNSRTEIGIHWVGLTTTVRF
ncbi:MAG: outer membrane protein transport protein [Verrucomicrobiota bacterium]|nr:outer membrane protein transport protein [Verrucomicrobiota bacterium]